MSDTEFDYLTEAEAARLWQRAAQLQAEAAQRAEAAEREGAPSTAVVRTDGYSLEHVRTAAVEAGIGAEYLDAALADLAVARSIPSSWWRPLADRFLDHPAEAITVSRVIEAPVQKVFDAMQDVFPREPYRLSLAERRGDPLDGGTLVFTIEGASMVATEGFTGQVSAADLRQVLATVRPVPGTSEACELTLRGPVAWAFGINTAFGAVMVGVSGGVGFGLGWVIGGALATALLAAGAAVPIAAAASAATAAGGAGAGMLGSVSGFRRLYDYSIGKGRKGLESVLSAVAMEAQGGWGIGKGQSLEP
ncbi:MAG: hypothetical protein OEN56_05620 [Gemmatimonadota bacterium]|nr:hypothetical protein [Gemmatimonadota bacterium]